MENGNETTKKEKEGQQVKVGKKKKKRKNGKKILLILVLVLIAGLGAFAWYRSRQASAASAGAEEVQTATVSRMDITSELSESSSLEPKDTYEVTSLVEGEIIACYFEEGDQVEKDQVLYVIDSSSTDSNLSTAQTNLTRAQENLQSAQEDYNEAVTELSGNTYKSTSAGYIQTLHIKEGDKISNGTQIADIYDDSVMKLRVPFLSAEADQIAVGSEATVTLEDTGEELTGTVTAVSSMEEALTGGRLVKRVTIEVTNPGGLTTLTQATASVGDFICSQEGTFEAKVELTMVADLSGNQSLEVETLLLDAGARVEVGTPIFQATAASVADYLETFEDSLETASDNLTSAQNSLEDVQDNIDDYTITAPISGTVISRNANVGENITRDSGSTTVLATIYDLSEMTFEMSVDELDVASVQVGQTVEITADAVDGTTYTGTVTNVSLESSYSNGVSTYPVTVTITDYGDLLPGMNVDARIITGSSEQALVVPAGALMRGNRVYVSEDSPTAQALASGSSVQIAPETESQSDSQESDSAVESAENTAQADEGAETESTAASDESAGAESTAAPEEGMAAESSSAAEEGTEAESADPAEESTEAETAEGTESSAGERPAPSGDGNAPASGQQSGESQAGGGAAGLNNSGAPEGFVAVQVETGIVNDSYVEILSGLQEGDMVYVDPDAGSSTGSFMMMMGPGGMDGGPGGGGMGGPGGGPQ